MEKLGNDTGLHGCIAALIRIICYGTHTKTEQRFMAESVDEGHEIDPCGKSPIPLRSPPPSQIVHGMGGISMIWV